MTATTEYPGTPTAGAPPRARKAMDAQQVGKINAAALKALGDVAARRKWPDSSEGSPVTTNMLCAEIGRLNLLLESFGEAAELFTEGAHAARDALNGAGLACPAAIARAAERARNVTATAKGGAA